MESNMRRRKFHQESQISDQRCDHFRTLRGQQQQWRLPSRRFAASLVRTVARAGGQQLIIGVFLCWLAIAQNWQVRSQPQISSNLNPRQSAPPSQPQQQQQQQSQNVDYLNLAQLFQLQPGPSPSSPTSGGHGWSAAADPNNRTTLRFFRNNKTFASVVYANENSPAIGINSQQLLSLPNNQLQQQQQQQHQHQHQYQHNHHQQQPQQQQPAKQQQSSVLNRLINCHLVDLEKHSTDVALFESKYDIRTVDIEFADMMQLIEACTEIARLRMPPINRLVAAVGSASSANGTVNAANANGRPKLAAGSPVNAAATNLPQPFSSAAAMKPLLVVGRPIPAIPSLGEAMTTTSTSSVASLGATTGTSISARSANELPLSIVGADQEGAVRTRRRIAPQTGAQQTEQTSKRQQQQQQQQQQREQDQQLMHRLTLGEVTPPASLVVNSKIREALQEITSYDTSDLMSIWRGILPGTNWCGMGDRATSYNDLGFESDIDICCRAHDFCPIRLSAFSSGYGLFNWSFYTRSHCRCDQNFLDCLRRAESPLASVVLKFYFAIMKTTCLHDNQTSLIAPGSTLDADANSSGTFSLKSSNSGNIKQHSHGIRMRNGNKLFEQLRAKLPIPRAVERSHVLLSKLDTKPQPQQQQQQMQRYAGSKQSIGAEPS